MWGRTSTAYRQEAAPGMCADGPRGRLVQGRVPRHPRLPHLGNRRHRVDEQRR
jgi:hypothetical protein